MLVGLALVAIKTLLPFTTSNFTKSRTEVGSVPSFTFTMNLKKIKLNNYLK